MASIKSHLIGLVLVTACLAREVSADLIPPGHKSVSHKLVFEDSPLLESHRLIAMPVRGFQGAAEVQAGRPFWFSSKYGTRLYVVPEDYAPPERISPGDEFAFPSCDVPVSSVTSVPMFSPVKSILTTLELTDVGEETIRVAVVDHVEYGSDGRPASWLMSSVPKIAIAAIGLVFCLVLWSRGRSRQKLASEG
jgi:hypothetical protein